MKLRTELPHTPLRRLIEPNDKIMLLGSCFTEHIGEWFSGLWLNVWCNPWGILFNPASIAQSLQRCTAKQPYTPTLQKRGEKYYSFDHHSSLSADTEEELLQLIQETDQKASAFLQEAQHLVVTWGTAWVYEREGKVVANCHKAPATEFVRRRLSVEEIVRLWQPIVAQHHTIFTVSPIRHIGDGLHGNQLSKSTLLLAIDQLQQMYPDQVEYLPVYELLMDDLRDYRFYADDLVHPSTLAIEAVQELVSDSALSRRMRDYIAEATPLVKTLNHRPSDPEAPAYKDLVQKTLEMRETLLKKYLIYK